MTVVGLCCSALLHAHYVILSYMLCISLIWNGLQWNRDFLEHPLQHSNLFPHVYVTMRGPYTPDLGAQMFQYASLYGVGLRNYIQPVWRNDIKLGEVFLLDLNDTDLISVKLKKQYDVTSIIEKSNIVNEMNCSECLLNGTVSLDPYQNATLHGPFRGFKYFKGYEKLLMKKFRFKTSILNHVHHKFYQVNQTHETIIKVGLHLQMTNSLLANITEVHSFIEKSVEYLRARHKTQTFLIVITTDDIERLEKDSILDSIKSDMATKNMDALVVSNTDSVFQMAMLSECDHAVICGGDSAWWGAWMVDRNKHGQVLYCSTGDYNWEDNYYYPHWIGL